MATCLLVSSILLSLGVSSEATTCSADRILLIAMGNSSEKSDSDDCHPFKHAFYNTALAIGDFKDWHLCLDVIYYGKGAHKGPGVKFFPNKNVKKHVYDLSGDLMTKYDCFYADKLSQEVRKAVRNTTYNLVVILAEPSEKKYLGTLFNESKLRDQGALLIYDNGPRENLTQTLPCSNSFWSTIAFNFRNFTCTVVSPSTVGEKLRYSLRPTSSTQTQKQTMPKIVQGLEPTSNKKLTTSSISTSKTVNIVPQKPERESTSDKILKLPILNMGLQKSENETTTTSSRKLSYSSTLKSPNTEIKPHALEEAVVSSSLIRNPTENPANAATSKSSTSTGTIFTSATTYRADSVNRTNIASVPASVIEKIADEPLSTKAPATESASHSTRKNGQPAAIRKADKSEMVQSKPKVPGTNNEDDSPKKPPAENGFSPKSALILGASIAVFAVVATILGIFIGCRRSKIQGKNAKDPFHGAENLTKTSEKDNRPKTYPTYDNLLSTWKGAKSASTKQQSQTYVEGQPSTKAPQPVRTTAWQKMSFNRTNAYDNVQKS